MESRGEAIVLIGFMGTGKSSVGRELARQTGLPRYDTDEIVSQLLGNSIAAIFSDHGEETFRNAEATALDQLPVIPAIIVTGGGLLLRDGHVERVRNLGIVVQLTANLDTLTRRLSRRATRPLLQTPDRRASIEQLLRARSPIYDEAADASVDTTHRTHAQVAQAVLAEVKRVRCHAI